MVTFRGGRLPNDPSKRRLRLKNYLTAAPDQVPETVDYISNVTGWPMYANDQWGDCVWAMIGHIIEAVTAYASNPVTPTEEALLKGYSDVTGFDPDAGPPGENPTDQGTVIQDALEYWRKVGIELPNGKRHKILGFAQVDHQDLAEVDSGLWKFCHLAIGMNFPSTAMDQFNAGEDWDVVPGAVDEGGHAISYGRRQPGKGTVITWAKPQNLTPQFWAKYVEEAWVVACPELVDDDFPEGVDTAKLNSDFESLTGEPGPFPVQPKPQPGPSPTPPPDPDPSPTPSPIPVDDADQRLARAAHRFIDRRSSAIHMRAALADWLTARGL